MKGDEMSEVSPDGEMKKKELNDRKNHTVIGKLDITRYIDII